MIKKLVQDNLEMRGLLKDLQRKVILLITADQMARDEILSQWISNPESDMRRLISLVDTDGKMLQGLLGLDEVIAALERLKENE